MVVFEAPSEMEAMKLSFDVLDDVSFETLVAVPREEARKLLSIFTWGHTFFELNTMLLDDYAAAKDSAEVVAVMQCKLGKKD